MENMLKMYLFLYEKNKSYNFHFRAIITVIGNSAFRNPIFFSCLIRSTSYGFYNQEKLSNNFCLDFNLKIESTGSLILDHYTTHLEATYISIIIFSII